MRDEKSKSWTIPPTTINAKVAVEEFHEAKNQPEVNLSKELVSSREFDNLLNEFDHMDEAMGRIRFEAAVVRRALELALKGLKKDDLSDEDYVTLVCLLRSIESKNNT
ncbi:MAG TPA: hypothetical protein VNJ08_08780 [Bacteriovoracaceae bacterium]|nr:hypothetical protein [Bacteriovoracaceae bacterium]